MAGRRQGAASASNELSVEAAHHYARIYGAARAGCLGELRRAGCSEEEAEDIFATTLEQIMRKLNPVSEGFGQAQTVALLKQACRQKLIDERRHRDVLRIVPLKEAIAHSDPTSQSAAEAAEAREAVAIGREAISSLRERDRRIFLQRHRLGLSPEEILRCNPGLSHGMYRKIMHRANARAMAAFEEIATGARCAEMRSEQLHRYVAEEASKAERRTIEAHLRHCRACGVEVARMRGRLHEIASSFLVLVAREGSAGLPSADPPARLLDGAWHGAEALIAASRAARERLRELAIRVTGGLSGPGGEGAVGQLAGVSSAKAASICAAGALTASCLAAGVLPGLELAGPKRVDRPPATRSLESARVPSAAPEAASSAPSSSAPRGPTTSSAKGRRVSRSTPRAPAPDSASPVISGQQTGTEFGTEAAGAGVPAPTYSSGASPPSDRSAVGSSSGVDGERQPTTSKPEFGL